MATRRKPEAEFDRVPPYNEDAERAVLGAMLINPDTVGTAIEVLHGSPSELFYFPAHAYIYEAILNLFRKSQPIDMISLKEQLVADGRLGDVGGLAYISDLNSVVPTSSNIEYYARLVLDKSLLRRLIQACTGVIGQAYEAPDDVTDLLDRAEGQLFRIAEHQQVNPVEPLEALLEHSVSQIEAKLNQHSNVTGIHSGIDKLDMITSGFQPSDMVILAARPSTGKTAFALNVARCAAVDHGKHVLIFSLEMAKSQLVQRLIMMQGRVNMIRLREGFLARDEFKKVQEAAGALNDAPIYIDDTPSISVMELRAKARRQVAKYGCDLIILDYIQLMRGSTRYESRQLEIADISRNIKSIARELNLPVLALSQLSRQAESEDGARPKLSHIRDSGAIEQDADVVMMLFKDKQQPEDSILMSNIILDVAKQRNGPTGEVRLLFEKAIQRFGEIAQGDRFSSGVARADYHKESPRRSSTPSYGPPGGFEPDMDGEAPF